MATAKKSDTDIHTALLIKISDLIDANSNDFDKLKHYIEATRKVPRSETSTMKNPLDLFDVARRRGVFPVGKNEKLKEIITEINLNDALDLIAEAERQMGLTDAADSASRSAHVAEDTVREKEANIHAADSISKNAPDRLHSLHDKNQPVTELKEEANNQNVEKLGPLRYSFGGKMKGYVLIINNFTGERKGSDRDVENIKDFFGKTLGFTVTEQQDLDKGQLEKTLTLVQGCIQNKLYECNLFITVITSHGDQKGIKTCKNSKEEDGERMEVEELVNFFKCDKVPVLAGQPKLFFVQACRGDKDGQSVDIPDDKPYETMQQPLETPTKLTSPTDADILVYYSSTPGHRCYRREDTGSWLITELFDVFRNCYQHLSLQSMITMASYNVASKEANLDNSDKGAKQVPCVVSTLLKDLYFTEKLRQS